MLFYSSNCQTKLKPEARGFLHVSQISAGVETRGPSSAVFLGTLAQICVKSATAGLEYVTKVWDAGITHSDLAWYGTTPAPTIGIFAGSIIIKLFRKTDNMQT